MDSSQPTSWLSFGGICCFYYISGRVVGLAGLHCMCVGSEFCFVWAMFQCISNIGIAFFIIIFT